MICLATVKSNVLLEYGNLLEKINDLKIEEMDIFAKEIIDQY